MNLKKLLLLALAVVGVQEALARGGHGGGFHGGGRGFHGGGRGWHRGGYGGWGWGLGGAGLGLATGYALGAANTNYPYYVEPTTTYVVDRSASQADIDALRAENRALSMKLEDLRRSLHMPTEQVHPAVQGLKQQNAWLKEQLAAAEAQAATK